MAATVVGGRHRRRELAVPVTVGLITITIGSLIVPRPVVLGVLLAVLHATATRLHPLVV